MIRLFLKLACSGGVLTLACLTNVSPLSVRTKNKKQENEQLENVGIPFVIDSIEKLELFEKLNSCVFGFVVNWNEKNVLTARQFLKKFPDSGWKEKVINAANSETQMCKDRKQVALSHRNAFTYNPANFQ